MFRKIFNNSRNISRNGNINIYIRFMRADKLTKALGQHILINPGIIDTVLKKSSPDDQVLEVGSGTGNLTAKLAQKFNHITCVEVDPNMIKELQVRMDNLKMYDKVTIINKDILSIDLPKFDVFIANIPYQISSPLIMKLLATPFNWKYATILLQEEFAQRLFSSPNSKFYGRISVMTQTFVTVRSIIKVTRQNFRPQPKVDSRFVKLIQHTEKSNIFIPEYEKFLTICFNRKHKLLKNLFHNNSFLTCCASPGKMFNANEVNKIIDEVLVEMKMDKKRAAELTVSDFQKLLNHFHKRGLYFSKKHPDLHLDDEKEELEKKE